jgi:hypothetical protein
MKLIVDEDVAKVAEFMMRNLPALKLRRIAHGLVELGDLIWRYPSMDQPEYTFLLERPTLTPRVRADLSAPQPNATLSRDHDVRDANLASAESNNDRSAENREPTR